VTLRIEKAAGIGFCFGVKRAIDLLEKAVRERGSVETLGAVVHNQQVLDKLAEKGVRTVGSLDDICGDTVAIGSHGVSPQVEAELKSRNLSIIDTTCPFVHRAQLAARRLAKSGFFVIIYGDADHTEIKSVLSWADGKGVASLDEGVIAALDPLPRRLGILSQTTQIPACFNEFVKKFIDFTLVKDAELRIIDTICHDIRDRQEAALELANRVDLMLVIGGSNSANTKRLTELCSAVTETYSVETAADIQPSWFQGKSHTGIAAGASTSGETINEVLTRLEALARTDLKSGG